MVAEENTGVMELCLDFVQNCVDYVYTAVAATFAAIVI